MIGQAPVDIRRLLDLGNGTIFRIEKLREWEKVLGNVRERERGDVYKLEEINALCISIIQLVSCIYVVFSRIVFQRTFKRKKLTILLKNLKLTWLQQKLALISGL